MTATSTRLPRFTAGQKIKFQPRSAVRAAPARRGEYIRRIEKGIVEVRLDGDPFTVCVNEEQVTPVGPSTTNDREVNAMPTATATRTTATRPTAKELRRKAKALGVEDWEELTLRELSVAVKEAEAATAKKTTSRRTAKKAAPAPVIEDEDEELEDEEDEDDEEEDEEEEEAPAPRRAAAKKTAAKKTAAKKTAAKKTTSRRAAAAEVEEEEEVELPENGNPFRPNSKLYYIAEEVIKGGKRSAMVKRLKRKVKLAPRNVTDDYDEDKELDRRVLIVGQILRNQHDFTVEREGRGADATIVATKN